MDSREIFSKVKFNNTELIAAVTKIFGITKNDILIVEKNDDWIKRNNESIIIDYKAFLNDKEDEDDKYYGYYYYDIYLNKNDMLKKLSNLQKELGNDVIITLN